MALVLERQGIAVSSAGKVMGGEQAFYCPMHILQCAAPPLYGGLVKGEVYLTIYIFTVYLKRTVPPDSSAHALLDLPAPPYAVLDALDKLRLEENGGIAWDIAEYPWVSLPPRGW
ncbi:hypothetical protein AALC17_16795 [Oscillospiraceae bacterium 38-13]